MSFEKLITKTINTSTIGAITDTSNFNFSRITAFLNNTLASFNYNDIDNSITLTTLNGNEIIANSKIAINNGSIETFTVDANGKLEAVEGSFDLLYSVRTILKENIDAINTIGVRGEVIWDSNDFYGYTNNGWVSLTTGENITGTVHKVETIGYNNQGTTINKYKVVRLNGYYSTLESVSIKNKTIEEDIPYGIAIEDITDSTTGKLLLTGILETTIDGSSGSIHDIVYSTLDGDLTLTETDWPIGYLLTTTTNAIIYVNIGGFGSGSGNAENIKLGLPDDGDYSDGLLPFTEDTTIPNAVDEINEILAKLAPAKPANLSGLTFTMSLYTARESGTSTSHNCTNDTTPTATINNFYDGDAGTLSAWIDGLQIDSRILTTANDTGSYGVLNITADEDPYVGQAGKEGFWKQLDANITATSILTYASHTYQLRHTTTGNSELKTFWVDNPITPSIINMTSIEPVTTTRYISGVPSLNTGDIITIDFDLVDAIRKHYNYVKFADITSSQLDDISVLVGSYPIPNENDTLNINEGLLVSNNVYSETITTTAIGYNSIGTSSTSVNSILNARVDTKSNESIRKISGSGQYPVSGYGGTFDSTLSLKTVYTEELQLLNSLYRVPTGNYTTNLPIVGPDYSSGMGTGYRYVTFQPTTLNNNVAFTLNIQTATGFSSIYGNSDLRIYAKVEGVTGWIDCDEAYSGVGNPTNDGDPAVVVGSSTATTRRITFGSITRSGLLYIRIGLDYNSTKTFSGITITNLS